MLDFFWGFSDVFLNGFLVFGDFLCVCFFLFNTDYGFTGGFPLPSFVVCRFSIGFLDWFLSFGDFWMSCCWLFWFGGVFKVWRLCSWWCFHLLFTFQPLLGKTIPVD